MRVTGERTRLMARDSTSTLMGQLMKASGETTNSMVTESKPTLTEQNMRVAIVIA